MKHCLIFFLARCVSLCAVAQRNRIYVDDFEVAPGSTVVVPVMLANQDTTRGAQFNVTLPPGLRFVEMNLTKYAERLKFVYNKTLKDGVCNVMIYQVGPACFVPGDTAIAEITLQAEDTFVGGGITMWKCRGATMDNRSIIMDGVTAVASVPMKAQGSTFLDAGSADN